MGKNTPPKKRKDWGSDYDLCDEYLLSAFLVPGQRVDLKEKA